MVILGSIIIVVALVAALYGLLSLTPFFTKVGELFLSFEKKIGQKSAKEWTDHKELKKTEENANE